MLFFWKLSLLGEGTKGLDRMSILLKVTQPAGSRVGTRCQNSCILIPASFYLILLSASPSPFPAPLPPAPRPWLLEEPSTSPSL